MYDSGWKFLLKVVLPLYILGMFHGICWTMAFLYHTGRL